MKMLKKHTNQGKNDIFVPQGKKHTTIASNRPVNHRVRRGSRGSNMRISRTPGLSLVLLPAHVNMVDWLRPHHLNKNGSGKRRIHSHTLPLDQFKSSLQS